MEPMYFKHENEEGLFDSDLMSNLTNKLIKELQEQREQLIFDRLKKLGIEINIEKEKRRRFPSLAIERSRESETIYYNNGTENGLRVITFVTKPAPFDHENMSISYTTTYY